MRTSAKALILFSIASPALGGIYNSPSELPTRRFDYIIVGAGAAGPIVANRLSETKGVSVLLVEAGGPINSDPRMPVPLLAPPMVPGTAIDWGYSVAPQAGYANRTFPYIRGKVLGGTTSINYMIHNTGPKGDWERYAAITGDKGWSWDAMRKYFYKSERMVPPADGHDTKGEWDPTVHGKDGMISLSLPGFKTPLDERILAAAKQLPNDFPYNTDQNSGSPLGISWTQSRIGGGKRDSSATAYLTKEHLDRGNLHVLLNAHVNRLVNTSTRGDVPIFRALELASGPNSPVVTLFSTREIVLTAGVINTPKILLLSGIGDKKELSDLSIPSIVHLPSVGKNMSDHPLLINRWIVNSNATYDPLWSPPKDKEALDRWNKTHDGPLANTVTNLIGWTRVPKDDPVFKFAKDPSPDPDTPHGEQIFYNTYFAINGMTRPADTFMTVLTVGASAGSVGEVTLQSNKPADKPRIDPKFFSHPFDVYGMVDTLKKADKLVTSKAFDGYVRARFGAEFAAATTDEKLRQYAINNAICLFHGVGTASMSPKGASWGVVDPDLRVKGVIGVRVADASVIPFVPSAHPMGPIQALAERAADLIKEAAASGSVQADNHAQFTINLDPNGSYAY